MSEREARPTSDTTLERVGAPAFLNKPQRVADDQQITGIDRIFGLVAPRGGRRRRRRRALRTSVQLRLL